MNIVRSQDNPMIAVAMVFWIGLHRLNESDVKDQFVLQFQWLQMFYTF